MTHTHTHTHAHTHAYILHHILSYLKRFRSLPVPDTTASYAVALVVILKQKGKEATPHAPHDVEKKVLLATKRTNN